jgi:hypothetical protein
MFAECRTADPDKGFASKGILECVSQQVRALKPHDVRQFGRIQKFSSNRCFTKQDLSRRASARTLDVGVR